MKYKIVIVNAAKTWGTNFEKAGEELAKNVNLEIGYGWEPVGGVTVGATMATKEPYLMQAMIRRDDTDKR